MHRNAPHHAAGTTAPATPSAATSEPTDTPSVALTVTNAAPAPHDVRRASRRAAFATAGFVIALAAPSSASAATASFSADGNLTITDQPGHAAVMTIAELSNPLGLSALNKLIVTDNTAIAPLPSACTHPLGDTTTLICDRSAVHKLTLNLGDGDDSVLRPLGLTLLGAQALPVGDTPMVINGGDGNDHLEGGDGDDVIDGGAGDDTILGYGGNDTLTGGLGIDHIEPGAGNNIVDVSTPEADSVAVTAGSTNTITASPNDAISGTGATTSITLLGVDVGLGGPATDGTPVAGTTGANVNVDGGSQSTGGTTASVDVNTGTAGGAGTTASVAVSVGFPSVDDLLGGVRGNVAGGSTPLGVTLPVQVNASVALGQAGKVGTGDSTPTPLPSGVTLTPGGLHIKIKCTVECDALGNGVVDVGGGHTFKLLPATVTIPKKGAAIINLGLLKPDSYAIQGLLNQGKCAVIGTRIRVKTADGDETKSYALPICGAEVTFELKSHAIAKAEQVTPVLTTEAKCSSVCDLGARFLEVKSGDTVIARVEDAKIDAMDESNKRFVVAYKLSARQQRTIMGVVRGGHTNIRYVVSANATSGGVATTGTATFRANEH